jgi:hypothetical protein
MVHVTWLATAVIVSACDAGATAKRAIDPCSVLTQSDANAFFGNPAVKQPSAGNECVWSYESSDHTRWSLQLRLHDVTTAKSPDIVVTKPDITMDGHPDPDPTIHQDFQLGWKPGLVEASNSEGVGIHWQHDARYIVHLKLTGPAAAMPVAKIDVMKQLALKVEAALAR